MEAAKQTVQTRMLAMDAYLSLRILTNIASTQSKPPSACTAFEPGSQRWLERAEVVWFTLQPDGGCLRLSRGEGGSRNLLRVKQSVVNLNVNGSRTKSFGTGV